MNRHIIVVCDNTMGIPGKEIDDGLALLYLLGRKLLMAEASEGNGKSSGNTASTTEARGSSLEIDAICTTHGNSSTEETTYATKLLCDDLGLSIPIVRGADAGGYHAEGSSHASEAANLLIEAARAARPDNTELAVLSLGAVTDLALAEQLQPGTLARFDRIALMGGLTEELRVGGNVMDELNFASDAPAALATFAASATWRTPALIADAINCLPLTFSADEFIARLATDDTPTSQLIKRTCVPWFERARREWNTHGFVGWDVLAAVALAAPNMVYLQPYRMNLSLPHLEHGWLAPASNDVSEIAEAPSSNASEFADVNLITIPDPHGLKEHVFKAWEAALRCTLRLSGCM
ncbi:nucleoside hydrolase [Adlercreutzia sp. ZJ138]|uniref:nucleoside hydrolase n=1 Tax=Adlercreutzia sp. ZJ138 TaxID=2709405 RepID=UPI0013EAF789|nr:nucleoside hydrolase [Adlercreutzia sp. ZJ138]